jgi:hypothetical protein
MSPAKLLNEDGIWSNEQIIDFVVIDPLGVGKGAKASPILLSSPRSLTEVINTNKNSSWK